MTTDRPLTLDVTDFGPIARACVELRPLTVFVGPSNTGKSWLATLAYALHRALEGPRRGRPWGWTRSDEPALPEGTRKDLAHILAQSTISGYLGSDGVEEGISLTPPVEAALRLHLEQQGTPIGAEIERCFGVNSGGNLVRHGSAGGARVLLRHAVAGVSIPAVHQLTLSDREWKFLSTMPEGSRIPPNRNEWLSAATDLLDLLMLENQPKSVQTSRVWEAMAALAKDLVTGCGRAFYLPADRTGLMNAHSTVVRALIQSATLPGMRGADPAPPLSGVRGDFLEQLTEMASAQSTRSGRDKASLDEVGKRIEDGILRGAIDVGALPGVAYPRFTYRPGGWETDLPLTNTSSMVSEIAPVVLYLRHVVAPGDLLIIDEPESHLHPAMQVAFTRQIAEIVRHGVRVIVTTHSEWVLEELGNVVGRDRLADGDADNPNPVSLSARNVGVWLFQTATDDSGSTVREIALDEESGLYPSGFDAVARQLHNDWAKLPVPRGSEE